MNLIEVLVAALLFAISTGSTLQIWSQTSLGVFQQERRQLLAERLEAELADLEASLRLYGQQQGPAQPPCDGAAASLQALLSTRPIGDGVQRQLTLLKAEEGLLLELAIDGLPLRRQRLYLPVALGLCSVRTTSHG